MSDVDTAAIPNSAPRAPVRVPTAVILLVGVLAVGLLGVLSYQFFPAWSKSQAPAALSSKALGALEAALGTLDDRLAALNVSNRAFNEKTQTIVETLSAFKTSFEQLGQQLDELTTQVAAREPASEVDTRAAFESLGRQLSVLEKRLSTSLTTSLTRAPKQAAETVVRLPSLRVTKIERWGATPNVYVEHARFGHRLRVGERVAGWTLRRIVDDGAAVVFQKGAAHQRVAVGG